MEAKTAWKRKRETPVCNIREKGGVTFLTFPNLEKESGFVHGFSTRLGGVSEGCLASMNLGFLRGDDPQNVRENFRRMAKAVGFDVENLVFTDQTHTANVRIVTREDCGKGFARPLDYQNVDGLITNEPGLILTTFYADCVPLYLVDPVKRAVGLSHSGWRGTVGKIGKATAEKMREAFGSRPEDLLAAIGPSICQDCYEVSEDVILEFRENFPRKYHSELFYQKADGKYQLNLWRANELIFEEAGIPASRICTTDLCTCCNYEMLFSHRASHGKRGSLAAFLGICKEE